MARLHCIWHARKTLSLKKHVASLHTGPRRGAAECGKCDATFTSTQGLKIHMRNSYSRIRDKPHSTCPQETEDIRVISSILVVQKFESEASLINSHQLLEPRSNAALFVRNCFGSIMYYRQHLLDQHPEIKPFRCRSCAYSAVREGDRNYHEEVHRIPHESSDSEDSSDEEVN
jgi:hypothetical protein